MLTTIKGYYNNRKTTLTEEPPIHTKSKVIVTFLQDETSAANTKRIPGGLKNKMSLPENFNEPLENLKEYT